MKERNRVSSLAWGNLFSSWKSGVSFRLLQVGRLFYLSLAILIGQGMTEVVNIVHYLFPLGSLGY